MSIYSSCVISHTWGTHISGVLSEGAYRLRELTLWVSDQEQVIFSCKTEATEAKVCALATCLWLNALCIVHGPKVYIYLYAIKANISNRAKQS